MTAPGGYGLVLPPGWVRFGVRDGTGERTLSDLLDEAYADLPADRFGPVRKEVERRTLDVLAQAREHRALDVFAPLLGVRGRPAPASLVVSDALVPDGAAAPVGGVAAVLAALVGRTPGAELVELPAGPAVRRVEHRPAASDDEPAVVRVTYELPVPEDPGRWLVILATVPDGHEPMTSALVELTDAIVLTLRWRAPTVVL